MGQDKLIPPLAPEASGIITGACQHFAFKEYLDPHGDRLFAGHSNGSVSFQLAQLRIGEEKFPVSLYLH